MKICQIIFLIIATSILSLLSGAQSKNSGIIVQVDRPVAEVQPTMWGVFFEDINLGADGGIYAELVKNRSFEFYKPMMGWKILGTPLTEGDFLVVKNNLQKKKVVETSNKKGLEQFASLYKYLSRLPVEITETPINFQIKIPLI